MYLLDYSSLLASHQRIAGDFNIPSNIFESIESNISGRDGELSWSMKTVSLDKVC